MDLTVIVEKSDVALWLGVVVQGFYYVNIG
jgi:hypothetical protein